MVTKNNPGLYDCYGKAAPDEPIFTLRAKDLLASFLVKLWVCLKSGQTETSKQILDYAQQAQQERGTPLLFTGAKSREAWSCAIAMRDWYAKLNVDTSLPTAQPPDKAATMKSHEAATVEQHNKLEPCGAGGFALAVTNGIREEVSKVTSIWAAIGVLSERLGADAGRHLEDLVCKATGHTEKFKLELDTLQEAVKKVLAQKFDDICWRDVYTDLAKLVGVDWNPELLPKSVFLNNCAKFHDSMATGEPYVTPTTPALVRYTQEHLDAFDCLKWTLWLFKRENGPKTMIAAATEALAVLGRGVGIDVQIRRTGSSSTPDVDARQEGG